MTMTTTESSSRPWTANGRWRPRAHQTVRRERRRRRGRAPRPPGVCLRLPRARLARQDHAHPRAARTHPRRRRNDVPARLPGAPAARPALARIGAIVDEPRFHGHLTGRQNLQILAAAREPAARGRIDASLDRVGMTQRADDKVSKYSMGMRQRLGVAACLLGDPQLLILDEPMNGLDPGGMLEMREMIPSLVAEGRTVVLSSHLLDEVERTCDAVAIVDRGKVIRQGPIAGLLADSAFELQIDCSTPDRAGTLLAGTPWGPGVRSARTASGWASPPAPIGRWWPRSTGSSSRAASRSTGSRRSTPHSSPGSSRSPPDWGPTSEHLHRRRRPASGRRPAVAGGSPTTAGRGSPTAP